MHDSRMGVAWLVPHAHGTSTMKWWSFDVRSWGPVIQVEFDALPFRTARFDNDLHIRFTDNNRCDDKRALEPIPNC